MPDATYVMFLNGGYGVGKSSALDHIGDVFTDAGHPFCLMDVDWFHRSWPPAVDDPENVLMEAANLAATWLNYRHAGPRQPVVAGVIASAHDRDRYAEVFGLPIRSVRLVAEAEVVEARLRSRYTEQQRASLTWHLDRHRELTAALQRSGLDEATIDTSRLTPRSVAEAVVEHFRRPLTYPGQAPSALTDRYRA